MSSDNSPKVSPLRAAGPWPKVSPLRAAWHCTYCGDEHEPDPGRGALDARYREGRCGAAWRVLIQDRDRANALANTGGKFRPKGTPLVGFVLKPIIRAAAPGETARAKGQP